MLTCFLFQLFALTFLLLYLLFARQISTNVYLVNISTRYTKKGDIPFYRYTPLDFRLHANLFFHLILCFQLFIPNLLDALHRMMPCVLVVQISEEIGFSFLKTFLYSKSTCNIGCCNWIGVCVREREGMAVGTSSSPRRI